MLFGSTYEELLAKALLKDKPDNVTELLIQGANVNQLLQQNPTLLTRALDKNADAALAALFNSGRVDASLPAVTDMVCAIARPIPKTWTHRIQWPLYDYPDRTLLRVGMLADAGVTFDGKDSSGKTFLHVLLEPYVGSDSTSFTPTELRHMIFVLEILSAAREKLLNIQDFNGKTPLHYACVIGSDIGRASAAAKAMVAFGANPDIADNTGITARSRYFYRMGEDITPAALLLPAPQQKAEVTVPAASVEPAEPPVVKTVARADVENEIRWHMISDDQVASVQSLSALSMELTEVFNFATQERLLRVSNPETKRETVETKPFDALPAEAVDRAFSVYKDMGGTRGQTHKSSVVISKGRMLQGGC